VSNMYWHMCRLCIVKEQGFVGYMYLNEMFISRSLIATWNEKYRAISRPRVFEWGGLRGGIDFGNIFGAGLRNHDGVLEMRA